MSETKRGAALLWTEIAPAVFARERPVFVRGRFPEMEVMTRFTGGEFQLADRREFKDSLRQKLTALGDALMAAYDERHGEPGP